MYNWSLSGSSITSTKCTTLSWFSFFQMLSSFFTLSRAVPNRPTRFRFRMDLFTILAAYVTPSVLLTHFFTLP